MTRRTVPPASQGPAGSVSRYRDRIFDSKRHDPYQVAGKFTEPTHCRGCGAVFHNGRWQWASAPPGAQSALCPACQRVRDKLPAGELTLEGPFVRPHQSDLVRVIRNEAEHELGEHPLHRIMQLDEGGDRVYLSTTDIHLPQRIGEALKRAYDGVLEIRYGHDEYSVRVRWLR
jgi:hypothetical protein